MRFAIILLTLAVLVSLAKAQPVFEEQSELQVQSQNEADETPVEEPAELADAMEELERREQETGDVATSDDSHSRQKRAVCYCIRRGRRVVCACRRRG